MDEVKPLWSPSTDQILQHITLHGENLRLPHMKGPQNLYCLFYAPYESSHSNYNLEIYTYINENHMTFHLRYHGLEFHSVLILAIFGSG